MTIRPILTSLLLAAAPAALAQSAPNKIPDSRTHIPTLTAPGLTPSSLTPQTTALRTLSVIVLPLQKNIRIARNSTCYAIDTYKFSQSATPILTGETTCQPASTSHLKATILIHPTPPGK